MIKTLEDAQTTRGDIHEDAPNKRGNDGSKGGFWHGHGKWRLKEKPPPQKFFTTASPPVPPVSLFVPTVVATASEKDSTAAVITTTTVVTPYTRRTRASRGIVMTSYHLFYFNLHLSARKTRQRNHELNLQKPTKQVGQAPKAYPYFEAMLKEFDRDDMFEAPIKSWRLYKSCRVHCLIIEGMIIYMLDDVEYPLPKTTLQKMLDHKCKVSEFDDDLIQMINLIREQIKKE
ncbi:hypothetical protein Tco_0906521 [Tanacetum coccineum]|uniref:Uncharacterized protein n=1 Tax=Tanacetum coccineum TaxID=301880 RepID=A0ABQ5CGP8_9ASTR